MTKKTQPPENTRDNTQGTKGKLHPKMEAMKWKPGECPNPGGRPKKKPLTEMYERLLEDPEFMAAAEESVRKMILSGRMVGQLQLKEMAERVEGKVTQETKLSGSVEVVGKAEALRLARERAAEAAKE